MMVYLEIVTPGYVRGDSKAGQRMFADLNKAHVARLVELGHINLMQTPEQAEETIARLEKEKAALAKENAALAKEVDKLEKAAASKGTTAKK